MTYQGNKPPQHQGGGGSRGGSGGSFQPVALPKFTLTRDPIAFSASAEEWAQRWASDHVKPAQLRRFYGEVKRIQQLCEAKGPAGWDLHKLEFKLLKAKAAYALRDKRNEREALVEFIKKGADEVKTKDDFDLFVLYFEAVVGFATPNLDKN